MDAQPTFESKTIFEYDDYRAVLGSLIQQRKDRGLPCSYRWMAQQAGYSSPNFFKLVLDGERDLTAEGADKVVQMFRLPLTQADYFRTLVQFQRAKDLTDKLHYAEVLVKMKPSLASFELQKNQFEYHRKWAYVILREVLTLDAEFRNADQIFEGVKTGLNRAQVEEGLQHLLNLGLVKIDSTGVLKVTHQTLKSGDRVINSALFAFHLENLEMAKHALGKYKAHEREFHGLTLRLTPEAYELARRKIQKLKEELLEISDAANSARTVYQLGLQLYPAASLKDTEGES